MRQLMIRWLMGLAAWLAASAAVQAASFGAIEIASHLGEPFFARIPLHLNEDERPEGLQAAIASRDDYQVLETYRDPVVARLRVELERAQGKVYLRVSSKAPVRAPFFNLILRLQQGHFTQFKKFPVLLDPPKVAVGESAAPQVPVQQGGPEVRPVQLEPVSGDTAKERTGFKPFDGWARASVYGPIVHGDMLSTVAQRLRIDNRYTLAQVVVALYEKNKDKFGANNFNLLKQGSMLQVPTAAEVERHSPQEASRIFEDHQRRWRELIKQPKYAAEKQAQEQRYKPHIRVGKHAEGTASAASAVVEPAHEPARPPADAERDAAARSLAEATAKPASPAKVEPPKPVAEKPSEQEATAAPPAKVVAPRVATAADREAKRRMDRLEHQLKRLQSQLALVLEQKRQAEARQQWLLIALGVLAVLLLVMALWMLRTRRARRVEETPEPEADPTVAESSTNPKTSTPQPTRSARDAATPTQSGPSGQSRVPAIDPLTDVDVYLRYGMEEEALKSVDAVLAREPSRLDAHLKKLLVLSFRADRETMQRQVAQALAQIDEQEHARFRKELAAMGLEDFLAETEEADALAGQTSDQAEPAGSQPAEPSPEIPAATPEQDTASAEPSAEQAAKDDRVDELEFDISDFRLDASVPAQPSSGLVEHNEQVLAFEHDAPGEEAQSAQAEEENTEREDDVRRLDALLKRLEGDDDTRR